MPDNGQLDLFDDFSDDDALRRELARINGQRKYHPIEVKNLLGCSLSMVYRLYGTGELRGIRVGTGIRVFGWSIARYIKENIN